MISPLKIAKSFVEKACKPPEFRHYKAHLFETAAWMKRLEASADEVLLTAAVLHDIERILKRPDPSRFEEKMKTVTNPFYLAWHQKRSADIAAALLRERGVDEDFIEKVHALILHHEEGGNDDQDLLKDADSLSFFETSIDHFLQVWVPVAGKEKVREKFDWMFHRITFPEAKHAGNPLYEKALKRLLD